MRLGARSAWLPLPLWGKDTSRAFDSSERVKRSTAGRVSLIRLLQRFPNVGPVVPGTTTSPQPNEAMHHDRSNPHRPRRYPTPQERRETGRIAVSVVELVKRGQAEPLHALLGTLSLREVALTLGALGALVCKLRGPAGRCLPWSGIARHGD